MELEKKIEALLFYKGEPVKIKNLAKLLKEKEDSVLNALQTLEESLSERGIVLITKDDEVTLGTAPEMSELIESIRKEELSKDLGKAGLETLSIILYKGPIARSEIDWIRGVNSSFIIRNLMIRGLVERVNHPTDSRTFLYRPSFELLSFMGIAKIEDLPDFEKVKEELENFIATQDETEEEVSDGPPADAFASLDAAQDDSEESEVITQFKEDERTSTERD